MNITVSVTGVEAVRAQFARLSKATQGQALAKTAQEVHDYVELEADKHTKTGALFQSVYLRRLNENTFEVGHDLQRAPHAVFVHWGTKPHNIKPKNKKALRWAKGGAFHFAKVVHHPGYKGDPWLKRAADLAPHIFARHVDNLLKKA